MTHQYYPDAYSARVSVEVNQLADAVKWIENSIISLIEENCSIESIVIQMPRHLSKFLISKRDLLRLCDDPRTALLELSALANEWGTFKIISGYEMKIVVYDQEKQGYECHSAESDRFCKKLDIKFNKQ